MDADTVRLFRMVRAGMRMKNEKSQLPHGCGYSAVLPYDPRRNAHETFRKERIIPEKKTGHISEKRK
jgi:hypothetical protein